MSQDYITSQSGVQEPLSSVQESILADLINAGHNPDASRAMVIEHVSADDDSGAPPRFVVSDRSSANWVLRKLAECDTAEKDVRSMVEIELRVIEARGETLLAPIRAKRQFITLVFGPQLEAFATAALDGKKERSIPLIHGILGFRKGRAALVIENEEALIQIAETQQWPDCVKVSKSIYVRATQALLELDHSWLLGLTGICHIEPAKDKFYVVAQSPSGTEEA